MFRKTPAREAGTWWMPQFHRKVVVAVQASPLTASAIQAVVLTWLRGGDATLTCRHGFRRSGPRIQTASMAVPVRMLYAVTTTGLCDCISFLLSSTQLR